MTESKQVYVIYYNGSGLGVGETSQPISTNDRVRFDGVTYIVEQVRCGRLDLHTPVRRSNAGDIKLMPV